MKNLNELAQRAHEANKKWWQNIDTGEPIARNPKELLALVISEIAECLEGERKNLMDDKLPHRKMAEVEMADAAIRLLDFAGGFGISLPEGNEPWIQKPASEYVTPENKGEALLNIIGSITYLVDPDDRNTQISCVLHMIQAYCTKHGYDLMGAFEEKMTFNATREDHSHEARRIAGGKQF